MSCFNLQMKPHKSWKTISSGLRSKLRKLKTSTTHVVATTRRLTSRSRRSFSLRCYREIESSRFIMSLYVDELYAAAQHAEVIRESREASSGNNITNNHRNGKLVVMKCESSSSGAQIGNCKAEERSVKKKYETVDDAWKAIVAKSPLLRVDERAEEFITKFRKDMMLQKEKSFIDYHEMIARGA